MLSEGTGAGSEIRRRCTPPAWPRILPRYLVRTGSPRPKTRYTAASEIARGVLTRRSHSRRQELIAAGAAHFALALAGGAAVLVVTGPPPGAGWSGRGKRTPGRPR